jgi:hypothetical protein
MAGELATRTRCGFGLCLFAFILSRTRVMPSPAATVATVERSATAAFCVHARAEPGIMPRLLELFAKRGLVPAFWHSALSPDERGLVIEIGMRGLADEVRDYMAASMRQIVGVDVVLIARNGG